MPTAGPVATIAAREKKSVDYRTKGMGKYDVMKQIRDEVVALKESPLYEYRTQNGYRAVLGEGSHDAKIMFIGEAPGKN